MSHQLTMIVEIPQGCANKYEYNLEQNRWELDRVLYGANFYPGEYGYLAETLDYDGDPLDVICLTTYPTFPGCHITFRLVGVMEMIDDGDIDTKLIGVCANDPRFNEITNLATFPPHKKLEITDFFQNYKNLQHKKVVIKGWGDVALGWQVYTECRQLYADNATYLNTKPSKKALIQRLNERNKANK